MDSLQFCVAFCFNIGENAGKDRNRLSHENFGVTPGMAPGFPRVLQRPRGGFRISADQNAKNSRIAVAYPDAVDLQLNLTGAARLFKRGAAVRSNTVPSFKKRLRTLNKPSNEIGHTRGSAVSIF
jgi:hypothetical protein